jgi:MFS family permease
VGGEWGGAVLMSVEHAIWLAIVLGVNVGHDLMYGPQAAFFSELFGTRVRYSGASLGYQLASVIAGGFAPLIAAALLKAWSWPAVALYMAVMAAVTVVATLLATETYQSDINADDPREQELVGAGATLELLPERPAEGGAQSGRADRYGAGRAGGSGRNTWRSNASAARRMVASSAWRPISIMPTGSPSDMAQGTFMAGWPVTSNGAVFGIISRALAT